ncbi:MAG TPA: RNA methyltransferase [Phycisphaerales bacterium]|nr:RNA methyltransferase [Phycisphaerales bacterium]
MPALNIIPLNDAADPRLADYADVKERQLAAEFGGAGVSGSAEAPHGKFYAEGKVVLHHLVRCGHATLSVLATPAMVEANRDDLERLRPGVPVYTLAHAAMERVIGFTIHRGLLAVGARKRPLSTGELLAVAERHGGPLVVLEDLSNHDNIGAIFRNAAALGACGVLLSPRCADPLYRKSLRVSVGLALRVPWATAARWPDDLNQVHGAGFETLALTPGGHRTLAELAADKDKGLVRGLALLVGAEGHGLTQATLTAARHRVRIPMASGVDSLNAATSCAVALYELGRTGLPAPPLP